LVDKHLHVYVSLERDEDGYPPFDSEELDAVDLGGGRFRLAAAPAFAYGLAPGDIVRAEMTSGDRRAWAVEVIHPSDNWLARIMPRAGCDAADVVEQFRSIGCDARVTPYRLITVLVPAGVTVSSVMKRLQDGQETNSWYFDLGVAPPA
jgi:hypothetical protein